MGGYRHQIKGINTDLALIFAPPKGILSGASRPRTPPALYTGLGGFHLGGIVDPFSLIFDDFMYF